jgi:hypothetical protein
LKQFQIPACVRDLSLPEILFPTSPFEEIHEVAKFQAAVGLDTIIDQMRQNPKQGCL